MSDSRSKRWLKASWPWAAAVASGLLMASCFPPFDWTYACWIALTPLLGAIWFSGENSKRRWMRDLLLSYVAGLTFFWVVFSWLTTVTIIGWFLLQFYMGLFFAAFGVFISLTRPRPPRPLPAGGKFSWPPRPPDESPDARSPWLSSIHNLWLALGVASAWTAQEWVRGWLFTGFGWNGLGVSLHQVLPLIQIADITGVAGVSFAVAFFNVIALASIRRFVVETRVKPVRPHYDFTITLVGIVGLCAYGIRAMQGDSSATLLRIACVQSNVPRDEKFSREFQEKTFQQFARLTNMAMAKRPPPQLIMWPESSMPAPVLIDQENYHFVTDLAAQIKTDLLLGTIDQDERGAYNAAILVPSGGQQIQVYRKLHLVPFGEYVPGRHIVPFLAQIIGDQVPADFAVGKEPVVFRLTTDEIKAAPLICFEDTLGELTRRFVLRGANLLANVTNDGWFLHSSGSQQHLANAIFRCVENRRPLARAANTGVTCFVNRFGAVTQVLRDTSGSQFTEGVLTGIVNVPGSTETTFYTRHGDVFAQACCAIALLFLLANLPGFIRRDQPPRPKWLKS